MRPGLKLIPLFSLVFSLCAAAQDRVVSSLGRLEPENGVVRLAGPSGGGLTGAVMKSLEVAEGDWVEKDQVIARLDSYDLRSAEVARLDAVVANTRSEMARQNDLAGSMSHWPISRQHRHASNWPWFVRRCARRCSKFMPIPASVSGRKASWNSAAPTACTRWPKCTKPTSPR